MLRIMFNLFILNKLNDLTILLFSTLYSTGLNQYLYIMHCISHRTHTNIDIEASKTNFLLKFVFSESSYYLSYKNTTVNTCYT